MRNSNFAIAAAITSLFVMNGLPAQETDESSSSSASNSAQHEAMRDAHRAAMQQQMREIQEIEDPVERQRRMDELHVAMEAMRDAMRSAHHPECAVGESCGHGDRGHMRQE